MSVHKYYYFVGMFVQYKFFMFYSIPQYISVKQCFNDFFKYGMGQICKF